MVTNDQMPVAKKTLIDLSSYRANVKRYSSTVRYRYPCYRSSTSNNFICMHCYKIGYWYQRSSHFFLHLYSILQTYISTYECTYVPYLLCIMNINPVQMSRGKENNSRKSILESFFRVQIMS